MLWSNDEDKDEYISELEGFVVEYFHRIIVGVLHHRLKL